ncbi:MAG: hypothetical protein C0601_03930 [Candidatus Muiribacterium halophilum]|uniref:Translocation and assembly module TamB C-terminal domain-containing protein n=1 Tax=Muiribacterium halophilum TaxID=2053465 RepID=A0A2N5ZJE2_MUIH1|nr:MAG: hypothetical protein C0601_03930 [Candidatus Muirbacterium halophilum]
MQKIIILTMIVLSLILLLFSFSISDEVEFFIRNQLKKNVKVLEDNGFDVKFKIKKAGALGIELNQIILSKKGLLDAKFDRLRISLDILRTISNLSYNIKLTFSNGELKGVVPSEQGSDLNSMKNLSIFFYNVDIDIKDLIYKGTKNNLVLNSCSGEFFPYIKSGKFFRLLSDNLKFIVRRTGNLLKGEIQLKEQKVKKYENFLRDFPSMKYGKGLFDAKLSFEFLNNKESLQGEVVFYDVDINFDNMPLTLKDFNGKILVEDDIRRFNKSSFLIKGKNYLMSGFRKSRHSMDLKLKDPDDDSNNFHIYGLDKSLKMDGNYKFGDYKINIVKDQDVKIQINSTNLNAIIYLSLQRLSGNFRVNFKDMLSFWGDYKFDKETFSFSTDRSFIRFAEKIFPFKLNYTGRLFFDIENVLEISLNPSKKDAEIILDLPFYKDDMHGEFDLNSRKISVSSENGYFSADFLDSLKIDADYRFKIDEIDAENIRVKAVEGEIILNSSEKLIKGIIKELALYDFSYKHLEYAFDLDRFCVNACSGEKTIEIKREQDEYYGEIKNLLYEGKIRKEKFSFNIKKALIGTTKKGFYLRPVLASFSFLERNMMYDTGEISFSKGTLEVEGLSFKDGYDTLKLSMLKDDKGINYEVEYLGNKPLKINDLITFNNKVLRIKGKDNNITGSMLFDNAQIDKFKDMTADGKFIFNGNEIELKDCFIKYNDANVSVNGKAYDMFSRYELFLDVKKGSKISIKKPEFSFEGNGDIKIDVKNDGAKIVYGVSGSLDQGTINIYKIPKDGNSLIPEFVDLTFSDLLLKYNGNTFKSKGKIDYSYNDNKNDVYIDVYEVKIDMLGNNFKVVEGVLSSVDIKDDTTEKKIRITGSSGSLDTEFKVNDATKEKVKKDRSFKDLSSYIWMDLLFSREIKDATIYVSIKGSALDRNTYFYSDPPMELDEIYEQLKATSIFSVLEANGNRSKLVNFLGAEKNLLKRFTKGFNFDSVDLKSDDDGVDLRIKKDLNERVSLNYNKGLIETEDSFGLEYKFNKNLFFESENKEKENRLKLKWKIEF